MKVFISYRHTGEDLERLRELLGLVRNTFLHLGAEVYCTFFDEKISQFEQRSACDVMHHALKMIDRCDVLFAVQTSSEKSEGMLIEVGYCIARNTPIIVATKSGAQETYLPQIGTYAFSWSTLLGLSQGIMYAQSTFRNSRVEK